MTGRDCSRIIDGLIVNDQGELVLDESLREHLEECPECRRVYERIEEAKRLQAPDYVPSVMERIRDMEARRASAKWLERLRKSFAVPIIFRPQIMIPAAVTIAIMIAILSFGHHLLPEKDGADITIAIVTHNSIATIADKDRQKETRVNGEIMKQIQLNLSETLDSDDSV